MHYVHYYDSQQIVCTMITPTKRKKKRNETKEIQTFSIVIDVFLSHSTQGSWLLTISRHGGDLSQRFFILFISLEIRIHKTELEYIPLKMEAQERIHYTN